MEGNRKPLVRLISEDCTFVTKGAIPSRGELLFPPIRHPGGASPVVFLTNFA